MTAKQGFFAEYMTRTGPEAVTKWEHYFDVYERELVRYLDRPISFLEIGVFKGGSIPMWKEYFAQGSSLCFLDIDPDCAAFEREGTHVRIGNQADPEFLAEVAKEFGPFDVILDDGSHINAHQITSQRHLWPHLADGGIYMVEDTHTSYWPGFGGGYRSQKSYIERAKATVDTMHSWYTEDDEAFPVSPQAKQIESVRFYDSIVVMEKRLRAEPPTSMMSANGKISRSRKGLQVRGRVSAFAGKDGS